MLKIYGEEFTLFHIQLFASYKYTIYLLDSSDVTKPKQILKEDG